MSERRAASLLERQMKHAFEMIRERLQGLTDAEAYWEPVPKAWTLRIVDGWWTADYAQDGNWPDWTDPEPPPFATIIHRLVHIASCKVMYHDHAFASGTESWGNLCPHTVEGALALLDDGQGRLMDAASKLGDEDLDAERPTNWGPMWPTRQLLWTMVHHDLQHGNEIAVVRDLYRHMVSG